jgi:hypothetical protein
MYARPDDAVLDDTIRSDDCSIEEIRVADYTTRTDNTPLAENRRYDLSIISYLRFRAYQRVVSDLARPIASTSG